MSYVDSSGVTHRTYEEASSGIVSRTTASRDATGGIVGNDTGSRYTRQQEAIQEQAIQQQAIQPTTGQGFLYPQKTSFISTPEVMQAVERQRAPIQQESPGIIDRMRNAFNQGYEAGSGNNYSLQGLTQPKTRIQDLYTYPIYQKSEEWQKNSNRYIEGASSYLPSGISNFVGGLGKGASGAVLSLGSIPTGLETIGRNIRSSPETISLGYGALAGAVVKNAKTDPLEFGGELVGAVLMGKVAGSTVAKISPKQVREVPITTTERQFSILEGVEKTTIEPLGKTREYVKLKTRVAGENELSPFDIENSKNVLNQDVRTFDIKYTKTRSATDYQLNTDIKVTKGTGQLKLSRPNIINGEQKTLTGETIVKIDKSKWNADFLGIPEYNKFNYHKQFSIENYPGIGKDNPDFDFATVVENTRARPIKELMPEKVKENPLPEGAELYFDVPKTPKQTSLFDDFSGNSNIVIHTPGAQLPKKFYDSLKTFSKDESGTLFSTQNIVKRLDPLPEVIQEPKVIPGRPKSELDFWKRDIILDELKPKVTTKIETFEIPNTYSSMWSLGGAGLSFTSPFMQIGEQTFNPVKGGIWASNAPKIDISSEISEKSGIGLKTRIFPDISQSLRTDLIPDVRNDIVPEIRNDIIPDIRNNVIPDIKPDIIPNFPNTIPDIKPDYVPDIKPDYVPTVNPFTFYNPDIIFPMGGGAWDWYRSGGGSPSSRRKARNKTLKNYYGDPFKLKINIKL
jgi:hypothetical protein